MAKIFVADEEGNPVPVSREILSEMRARRLQERCLASCVRPEDEDPEDLFYHALHLVDPHYFSSVTTGSRIIRIII